MNWFNPRTSVTRTGDFIVGLLAASLVLACFSFANAQAWPITIEIGGPRDNHFIQNFYAAEAWGDVHYRWTNGDSQVIIPAPSQGETARLSLDLFEGRVTPEAPRTLQILVDEVPLTTLILEQRQFRTYHLVVPVTPGVNPNLAIRLLSDAPLEYEGGRTVGVSVLRVAVATTDPSLPLPSLWLMIQGLALGAISYSALRLTGIAWQGSLVGALGLGLVVALLIVVRPVEVLPFVHRFTALVAVLGLGLVLVSRFVLPEPDAQTGRLVLQGRYLALLFGVGFWMALLFQSTIRWEGVESVGSPWWMELVGSDLGLLGLGWIGWRSWRDQHLPLAEQRTRSATPVLVVLAGAALLMLGFSFQFAFSRQAPDFWILYRGTMNWMRGGSLYNLPDVITNHFGRVFKVPPFYGMFFIPAVAGLDDGTALWLHRCFNVLLITLTAGAWLRMWRLPLVSLAAASLLIVFNFRPLFDTIAFGQIDILLLFLLTLALWALREERDGLAGMLVALGTLFKIYPLILLAFFVLKGRWRALLGFGAGMLLFNGIAVVVVGWEQHRIYLFEVLPRIGGTTAWVENQTISGFLARFTASPRAATIFHNPVSQLLGLGLSGLMVLVALALTLRPAPSRSTAFALQYGFFLLLMVLTVPAAWMHYETLLIVPFATLLLHYANRNLPLTTASLLTISFALIAFGNQWSYYDGTVMGMLTIFGISYKLYGMLILAGVLTATIGAATAPWYEHQLIVQVRAWFTKRHPTHVPN